MPEYATCDCCRGYVDYAACQVELLPMATAVPIGSRFAPLSPPNVIARTHRCRDCAEKCHIDGPCYLARRGQVAVE